MTYFPRKLTSALFLTPALFISAAPAASGDNEIVTPPKTHCYIKIGDAHISDSIEKRQGRRAVKINALSICNREQSEVVLVVKIFKRGIGTPHLVVEKSTKADNPKSRGLIVRNQFTFKYCKNYDETKYFGIAYSRARIDGKIYTTPFVWTAKDSLLNCGT